MRAQSRPHTQCRSRRCALPCSRSSSSSLSRLWRRHSDVMRAVPAAARLRRRARSSAHTPARSHTHTHTRHRSWLSVRASADLRLGSRKVLHARPDTQVMGSRLKGDAHTRSPPLHTPLSLIPRGHAHAHKCHAPQSARLMSDAPSPTLHASHTSVAPADQPAARPPAAAHTALPLHGISMNLAFASLHESRRSHLFMDLCLDLRSPHLKIRHGA